MDHNLILKSNNWKEFKTILEPLNNTEEGRIFEELTRLYLLTEPTFSTKIEEIWHHSDVPQKIVDELGLQQPEIGVDLIAQVKDGTYWAIQCKYHEDQNRNVSYKELSTFLSITERDKTYPKLSHRLVCTSANEISRRVQKAHPEKLGYLTSADFSKLGNTEFETFRDLLGGESPLPTPFSPKPHQSRAVDNCVAFFKNKNNTRGKIIHPCGSGKSLTGYWIAEKLQSKNILLAVPSLALVRQTLSTWTREAIANGIEMDWIAVCSDEDVKSSDDPLMQRVDLGIEVNTNPETVKEFLLKRKKGNKVVITTYQSGKVVSEGLKKSGKTFDLGIFDEAHKTVGQKDKKFAHLLYDKNIKIDKRVFMTATERQFKGNSDEYLSMDDIEVYGEIIDKLSFKEALEQKEPILSDYKIVTTLITKTEIEELINENNFVKSDGTNWSVEGDASTFAALIALRKIIRERNLNHAISFHSNIKRSKDFQNLNAELSKADNSFEQLSSFHVSGKDSTGIRAAELERFIDSSPSLITNARCLTEGVDVPAIDAVLFADPKQSKIDIVQAAGRALRKFKGKKFGYIIVPVVLDEGDENLINETYKQIITVISALGMNDERIIDQYSAIANGTQVQDPIVEIEFPEIIRFEFKDLISNIEILIWDRLSFGWEKGFRRLQEFVKLNKHARVPNKFKNVDGFGLGRWVAERRKSYQKRKLSSERIQQLESIPGWIWNVSEYYFELGLKELKEYIKNGRLFDVPTKHIKKNDFNLGRWVSYQRREFLLNRLSRDRIEKLESFKDWVWDVSEEKFLKGLEQLRKYLKENKNVKVPVSFTDKDGYKLGKWVAVQRRKYQSKKLDSERIKILESLNGWVWNVDDEYFEIGFKNLQNYIENHKHARVSVNYRNEENFRLGKWVSAQRSKYSKNKLSLDQIRRLDSLEGWVWKVSEEVFEDFFNKINEYSKEFKNTKVNRDYIDKEGYQLGKKLSYWRTIYRRGRLSSYYIKKLESLEGWSWSINEDGFEEGFKSLKKYEKKFHHPRVTRSYVDEDGFALGKWVNYQRLRYNKKKLPSEKIKLLESVKDWVWNISDFNFQEGYEKLKQYVKNNQHARVPISFKDKNGFTLGAWVSQRRREKRIGILSLDRIQKLESIKGWIWDVVEEDFKIGLKQLKKYVKENGDAKVSSRFVDKEDFKLGLWVGHRRNEYHNKKLSSDRIKKLESVEGWVWRMKG